MYKVLKTLTDTQIKETGMIENITALTVLNDLIIILLIILKD
jgi:hypothetical protein